MESWPSRRKKHYLTGIDWIIHVLDYMNKKATGAGNTFQIVMDFDGAPTEAELRAALDRFAAKFPELGGRVRRDYNLAPYWAMPRRGPTPSVPLRAHCLRDERGLFRLLEEVANEPFSGPREHVAFHLIRVGERSCAAVKFDHRLFDAHGAEAFLYHFQRDWETGGACDWSSPAPEPAHLNQWRAKFEAGRQVNRTFVRLGEGAPSRVLPLLPPMGQRGFRFRSISFGGEKSKEILERVESEAGYLMIMPYMLALTVQLFHRAFSRRGIDTGDYIVPVTADNRSPSKVDQEMFFNHVSFLWFRLPANQVDDFAVLLDSIKKQMYEQVKSGLAHDLWEASFLMRIVPPPVLSRLTRSFMKGERVSFCFSYVGDNGHMPTRFMGREIRQSRHMTRVPIPPGLGLFFQQSRGLLNAYLSYAEGLLEEDEASSIMETLRSSLGS